MKGSFVAYSQDLKSAARRHLRAAQLLYEGIAPGVQPGGKAVAGYLFGLAGELALKQIMSSSGMGGKDAPKDGPFYAHFPKLKTLLKKSCSGRRSVELRAFAEDPRLFMNWDITMRYAPATDITPEWVDAWRKSAKILVDKMETT